MNAGDNLDQGGFARSIISDDPNHLPGIQSDADIVHRHKSAKPLGDILNF
jgi:hypothetical protein